MSDGGGCEVEGTVCGCDGDGDWVLGLNGG